MAKAGAKTVVTVKKPSRILITQPRPESPKSPYFEMGTRYDIQVDFHPFIKLEGIPAKEFRKQKIEIPNFTAVIFTSRNAIDHFFRICEEMKITVSQETKYFCITEAVALYLQKFILYRKRKVFYGADGSNKSMFDVVNKHKANEKFLYVCSENQQDNEIVGWLKLNKCEFQLAFMYRTVSADVRAILEQTKYDILCFFTPSGVRSLFENVEGFTQGETKVGVFGENTAKAAEEAGLRVDIKAPAPGATSMSAALDKYLSGVLNKA